MQLYMLRELWTIAVGGGGLKCSAAVNIFTASLEHGKEFHAHLPPPPPIAWLCPSIDTHIWGRITQGFQGPICEPSKNVQPLKFS